MTFSLTDRARFAVGSHIKEPNIVLEIEGVDDVYGAIVIREVATIGDASLEVGDPETNDDAFYIGGLAKLSAQENAVSMDQTTTQIKQTLDIDLGKGGSISTMSVALIDTGSITRLITPGNMIPDILQAKVKVYLGFSNIAFPEDYIVIFRGVVTDVTADAGKIVLQLNHPDDKKQGSIFKQAQPKLSGAINSAVTTITLDSVADMLEPVTGPDGSIDASFQSCVRIDDEIIRYTSISGNQILGCTRGHLFTTAAAHADEADVSTFYRLNGGAVDLALKIMASTGDGSNYLEDISASSFVDVDGVTIANALYFQLIDVVQKYNIAIGDYITTSGASNGANNVSLKLITDIIETDTGTYLVVDGVTFVSETATAALVAFRSQYDTLPDGLALTNDEIDIDEHQSLNAKFLSDYEYDFYLKETIDDTRTFIEEQIYSPVACFSLPRKSRCSIGYHIGPLPGQDLKQFDITSIKEPSKMKLKRSTNRQFYNEIIYKYDESILTTDFLSGVITISELSKAQIKGYNKTLTIEAHGMRSLLDGASIAASQSSRRLDRYQYAAEVLSFGVMFSDGYNVEIGDIVWIDGTDLQLPDIKTATKGMAGRYFFVQNKSINFKTGDIQLDVIDTNFNGVGRYGLMSPSSQIVSATSETEFIIGESYSAKYGTAERKKWTALVGCVVRVRNDDFSVIGEATLMDASTNTISLSPGLGFTPLADYVMELVIYTDQTFETVKLVYVHMKDTDFADGKKQFTML